MRDDFLLRFGRQVQEAQFGRGFLGGLVASSLRGHCRRMGRDSERQPETTMRRRESTFSCPGPDRSLTVAWGGLV